MDPEIEVVGMADNGQSAVDLMDQVKPNVVLMDIHMPIMNGLDATQLIKKRWPEVRVIILTTFQEIEHVKEALSLGAEGYLLKAIHPHDLISGIKLIHHGGTLLPQDLAKLLIEQLKNPTISNHSSISKKKDPYLKYGLSDREIQVLQLLSQGLSNRSIAEKLFLSEGTVKNYVSTIYSKMEVKDRIQAVRKAQEDEIV
jgi:DNA-binding NarL/FixJ family response regulator